MKTLNETFEEEEFKKLEKKKGELADKIGLPILSWKSFIMFNAGFKKINNKWVEK